jgi:5-methylcytosine-specific restriction protein B
VPPAIEWPRNLFIGGTVNMDETTHAISDKVLDRAFTVEFWDVDLTDYFERRAAAGPATSRRSSCCIDLHAILRGIRRHFGYRTAGEVLAMLDAARAEGITASPRILDQAVFSKVLPRIRGHESKELSEALRLVRERCDEAGLQRCATKLPAMEHALRTHGLTRFWA